MTTTKKETNQIVETIAVLAKMKDGKIRQVYIKNEKSKLILNFIQSLEEDNVIKISKTVYDWIEF